MPKVSVIIPVYNAHEYLCACIDSVVGQTLEDIEIICVDDGSTDDSLEILNRYQKKDSRIIVLHQENSGAGVARNYGLRYATGEYLSFLDCDDFFELNMLEISYTKAASSLDILVFGCDFFDDVIQQFNPCSYSINRKLLPKRAVFCANDVQKDIFKLFVGWAWDKLIRREFVKTNNLQFQNLRTSNDLLFVFSAILQANRIAVNTEILVHHRQTSGSLSVTREKSWMCFHYALTALREQMQKIGIYDRFEQDFKNYYVHFSLWNLETLKEPAYTLLYNKLREEWFEEMGLLRHSRSYFYNKREFASFRSIYKHSREWWEADRHTLHGRIRRFYRCICDHGIAYTLSLATGKIKNQVLAKKQERNRME